MSRSEEIHLSVVTLFDAFVVWLTIREYGLERRRRQQPT
jgi:uncharacterized membrane protein